MLLSFSIAPMLPMLRAGLAQRAGDNVDGERVKRQTIRGMGPRSRALVEWARAAHWTIPYDLHLWWKSRTPQRALIGKVEIDPARPIWLYPIKILHSEVVHPEYRYDIWRIDGPRGWRGERDAMIFWSKDGAGNQQFEEEAYADGFESARDFCNYFAPNLGDEFDGALFKW